LRLGDTQEQGHEVGVGHDGLAVVPGERSDRSVESAARRLQRSLRMNRSRWSRARVHHGEPRRAATHRRPDQIRPQVMPVNNAKPASAIIKSLVSAPEKMETRPLRF
jgi:hypothetical protein